MRHLNNPREWQPKRSHEKLSYTEMPELAWATQVDDPSKDTLEIQEVYLTYQRLILIVLASSETIKRPENTLLFFILS